MRETGSPVQCFSKCVLAKNGHPCKTVSVAQFGGKNLQFFFFGARLKRQHVCRSLVRTYPNCNRRHHSVPNECRRTRQTPFATINHTAFDRACFSPCVEFQHKLNMIDNESLHFNATPLQCLCMVYPVRQCDACFGSLLSALLATYLGSLSWCL